MIKQMIFVLVAIAFLPVAAFASNRLNPSFKNNAAAVQQRKAAKIKTYLAHQRARRQEELNKRRAIAKLPQANEAYREMCLLRSEIQAADQLLNNYLLSIRSGRAIFCPDSLVLDEHLAKTAYDNYTGSKVIRLEELISYLRALDVLLMQVGMVFDPEHGYR